MIGNIDSRRHPQNQQLISEKYRSGKIVNVGYDANGRLSSVADAQRTYLSNITFNSQTLPSQINFGNGTNQNFGFNDRLQMTLQELTRGSEVVQKYDYGYGQIDSNGNLDTTKNNGQLARIESYIGAAKQWTQKFSYDSIGRLSEAKEYRGDTNALTYKQKFDFDRFGNLYRKVASNPTTGQENPLPYTTIEDSDIDKNTNRFTSATGTTYNEAGEVVSDNKFRLMNFSYDANGRMVKATKTSVPDTLSIYDALGNRVATKVNDVWQFAIYDAFGKLIAEYGGITASDEGGVKYILSDWQGSVRAVLNNAGFAQSRTDYQVFGEEIQSGVGLRTTTQGFSSGITTRQGYGLTERDDSTGLNHTWFRKNENRAGRWTSPDPYNGSMNPGNPQSFNRYLYVENQPTNFVDPSGLLMQECGFRTYVVSSCIEGVGCTIDRIEVRFECTAIIGDTGRRGPGDIDVGGSSGTQNFNLLGDETEKARKRAECLEDFKDKAIDITVENFWRQSAIVVGFIIAAILTSTTGAGPIVAAIIAVSLSLIQTAVAINKLWAADRDYQKCLRMIR